ncbi:hypothetical protein ACFOYW_18380 [Gryllotalpicola reticulitermitis]|uniref:Uncharacterized protein n=1 Tax=Gryllotalpicola reticulitermitis TaxID=1184153 RepID=A0ABV8QAG1_9MICO
MAITHITLIARLRRHFYVAAEERRLKRKIRNLPPTPLTENQKQKLFWLQLELEHREILQAKNELRLFTGRPLPRFDGKGQLRNRDDVRIVGAPRAAGGNELTAEHVKAAATSVRGMRSEVAGVNTPPLY